MGEGPYHVISAQLFLEALWRAHNGENPDLVYAELLANSEIEEPTDGV